MRAARTACPIELGADDDDSRPHQKRKGKRKEKEMGSTIVRSLAFLGFLLFWPHSPPLFPHSIPTTQPQSFNSFHNHSSPHSVTSTLSRFTSVFSILRTVSIEAGSSTWLGKEKKEKECVRVSVHGEGRINQCYVLRIYVGKQKPTTPREYDTKPHAPCQRRRACRRATRTWRR